MTHFVCSQSGAIMAVLGAVCTHVPDATLSIILLPFITFSAGAVSIINICQLLLRKKQTFLI